MKGVFLVANLDVVTRGDMETCDFDYIMQTITKNIDRLVFEENMGDEEVPYQVYLTNPTDKEKHYAMTLSDFADNCNDEMVVLGDSWTAFLEVEDKVWDKWKEVIYPYIDFVRERNS